MEVNQDVLDNGNIKILDSILEDTLIQLDIGKKIAIAEIEHLEFQNSDIHNDYNTAINIFKELQQEIKSHGTLECLKHFIHKKEEEKEKVTRAQVKWKEAKEHLKILEAEIAQEDIQNYHKAQALNIQLGNLKDQYQNEIWEQFIKLGYSMAWLEAQKDQHEIQHKNKESMLETEIKQLEISLEEEYRVHDELEDFYSMKLGDFIQQLVFWIDKYENDKNDYDNKISIIKSAHAILLEKTAAAKKLYASRQAEIAEYEEIKENRRLEEIHLAHLNAKATKIQAWWKGMMVRCKLGPYKIKKSKGKGKNKKK